MDILIATPLYPPDTGGPATYTKLLEDALPSETVTVRVATFGTVRDRPRLVRHAAFFWQVLKRLRGTDAVLALDPVSVGLPALAAARIRRKQFVLKVVGDFAWEQHMQRTEVNAKESVFVDPEAFQKMRFGLLTELRRFVERFVAKRADRVIVPSVYLKKIVMLWGVRETKITVIYNAFTPPNASDDKQTARAALGLSGTVLVSAGRLVPWKGMRELVGILPDILREFPDTHLYISGDGPEEARLRRDIDRLNLSNHVTLLGRLNQEALFRYIAAADVFVLYTGYEGLSHQLLETMAIGTPILSTTAGGNTELITDGQSGRLVPFGNDQGLSDALLGLLSHPPAGAKFAMVARNKAYEFTIERMVGETIKVLTSVIE